jgi:hypothetical protein
VPQGKFPAPVNSIKKGAFFSLCALNRHGICTQHRLRHELRKQLCRRFLEIGQQVQIAAARFRAQKIRPGKTDRRQFIDKAATGVVECAKQGINHDLIKPERFERLRLIVENTSNRFRLRHLRSIRGIPRFGDGWRRVPAVYLDLPNLPILALCRP